MESLGGGVRQSRVLSLSYRPEDSVRIPMISSTKSSEFVGGIRRARPEGTTDRSIDLSCKPRTHRSRTPVQDQSKSSLIPSIESTDRSSDRSTAAGDDTEDGRIIRPLERASAAADPCYWHTSGMLDGRSKSFVLPDRCPARRSHPIGIERSAASPLPAVAAIVPSSVGSNSIQQHQQQQHRHHHHHGHHHHYHEHQHHHQHRHQDQEQQRPPLSSSSTSSSFSSTDHIMLPPSPTTPSVITTQAVSRVRTAATSSTSRVHDDVVLCLSMYLSAVYLYLAVDSFLPYFLLCIFVMILCISLFILYMPVSHTSLSSSSYNI